MTISKEQRAALNEALDETGGYNGDVYVFDVKHVETLRSAVVAMLEDDEQAALESRVLAERKLIYQVLEPCEASWQDVDWLTYESTDGAFKRIVYDAHPTPDDASVSLATLFEVLMRKNIVTSDESYLSLRCVGVPPTEEQFAQAVRRAILAAKEKK
jgi:hypothetical protein